MLCVNCKIKSSPAVITLGTSLKSPSVKTEMTLDAAPAISPEFPVIPSIKFSKRLMPRLVTFGA